MTKTGKIIDCNLAKRMLILQIRQNIEEIPFGTEVTITSASSEKEVSKKATAIRAAISLKTKIEVACFLNKKFSENKYQYFPPQLSEKVDSSELWDLAVLLGWVCMSSYGSSIYLGGSRKPIRFRGWDECDSLKIV